MTNAVTVVPSEDSDSKLKNEGAVIAAVNYLSVEVNKIRVEPILKNSA